MIAGFLTSPSLPGRPCYDKGGTLLLMACPQAGMWTPTWTLLLGASCRCIGEKGEDAAECAKFAKCYRSLCPGEWVSTLVGLLLPQPGSISGSVVPPCVVELLPCC